jgi:hypothetical protein
LSSENAGLGVRIGRLCGLMVIGCATVRDRPRARGTGRRGTHGDGMIVDDVGSGPGIMPSTDCV